MTPQVALAVLDRIRCDALGSMPDVHRTSPTFKALMEDASNWWRAEAGENAVWREVLCDVAGVAANHARAEVLRQIAEHDAAPPKRRVKNALRPSQANRNEEIRAAAAAGTDAASIAEAYGLHVQTVYQIISPRKRGRAK